MPTSKSMLDGQAPWFKVPVPFYLSVRVARMLVGRTACLTAMFDRSGTTRLLSKKDDLSMSTDGP